jgi:hypothetical protein
LSTRYRRSGLDLASFYWRLAGEFGMHRIKLEAEPEAPSVDLDKYSLPLSGRTDQR